MEKETLLDINQCRLEIGDSISIGGQFQMEVVGKKRSNKGYIVTWKIVKINSN